MRQTARLVLAAALLQAAPASAQVELHGHLKYQVSLQRFEPDDLGALLVERTPIDHRVDGRLNVTYRHARVDVTGAGELLVLTGDTIAGRSRAPADAGYLLGLPDLADTHQWFDLAWDRTAGDRTDVFAHLDRLSAGYTGDRFVARIGRQALSWGNGLVFQTLDLFNPFPPNVLDVDYKPGRDMLTTQWLLPGGDDIQAIAVPGRARRGEPLTAAQSSTAVKWHHTGAIEFDVLAARHDGDTVVGGGASHGLAGGVWRADVSHTDADGRQVTSLVANYDRAWTPGGRTLYAFGEYFYNGFGIDDTGLPIVSLDPALLARLERGELFNLGRHEIAGGVRYQWTPLLMISPTVIVNPRDGSRFALVQAQYDWAQNLVLFAGVQAGMGSRGTEYGGVADACLGGYLAPGARVWARLARYF